MSVLDTLWMIKDAHTNRYCLFSIEKAENTYWLTFKIYENDEVILCDKILLVENDNRVLRTDSDYHIEKTIQYEKYTVISFSILIKIKNEKISPISTVYLSCLHPISRKKRIFALSLDECCIRAYCEDTNKG